MTTPDEAVATWKGIPLLLTQPPTFKLELIAQTVKDGAFSVADLGSPPMPAWQTQPLQFWDYPPLWLAADELRWDPFATKEATQQVMVAAGMARRLVIRLRQRPDIYLPVRSHLQGYWTPLMLGTFSVRPRSGLPLSDVDRVLIAAMVVFDLAMLISPPGETTKTQPIPATINRENEIARKLTELAPGIRRELRQCLEQIDYQPDFWAELALFGLLLHPQGMVWLMSPFVLGGNGGRSEVERGIELAVDATESTHRSASKFHRAYRKSWGVTREQERPGPKPGGTSHPGPARQKFEDYVLGQSKLGASAYAITQENEAQWLYGEARRDHAVVLNEQAVRRVLRKHGNSKNPP